MESYLKDGLLGYLWLINVELVVKFGVELWDT